MKLKYRPAGACDGRSCAEIVRDWSLETPWLGPLNDFESVVQWWTGCLLHVDTSWVCEDNGKVVGFCVRQDDNITGLYVSRDARARRIGKHLLDMAKVDREWITVWAYEQNPRARKYYRRADCVEISREIEAGTGLVDVAHRRTKSK